MPNAQLHVSCVLHNRYDSIFVGPVGLPVISHIATSREVQYNPVLKGAEVAEYFLGYDTILLNVNLTLPNPN